MVKGTNHIFFDVNNTDITVISSYLNTDENGPVNKKEIELFPNPVVDILYISNPKSKTYEIYDSTNRLVDSGKIVKTSINVRHLEKGVYIIKIGENSKRFIKN